MTQPMNTFHRAISLMRKYGTVSRKNDDLYFSSTSLPHDAFNALYDAVRALGWSVKVWGHEDKIIFHIKTI